jgi:hypothetical protein
MSGGCQTHVLAGIKTWVRQSIGWDRTINFPCTSQSSTKTNWRSPVTNHCKYLKLQLAHHVDLFYTLLQTNFISADNLRTNFNALNNQTMQQCGFTIGSPVGCTVWKGKLHIPFFFPFETINAFTYFNRAFSADTSGVSFLCCTLQYITK